MLFREVQKSSRAIKFGTFQKIAEKHHRLPFISNTPVVLLALMSSPLLIFFVENAQQTQSFKSFGNGMLLHRRVSPPNILLDFPSGFNTWVKRDSVEYKFLVQGKIHRPANFRRIRKMERTG